jgi:2-polyprenyl-6-methoxyphenol hydroxylase-like FAD-dependent oxidoreductase
MKAIICGAGISGISAAWWLEMFGWEVVLIERAESLRAQGYMIDFFGPGCEAVERMRLFAKLEEVRYRVPKVVWMDLRHQPVASLNYALVEKITNGKFVSLMRGDLERTLFENLPPQVDVRFGCSVMEIEPRVRGIKVVLTDGTTEEADLLIGADGIHSRIRELIFGECPQFFRYLGYHTAAFDCCDWQINRWLAGECKIISMPGMEAGFYPLRDNQVAAFFLHDTPDLNLPDDPVRELRRRYREFGWPVQAALEAATSRNVYYDLVAQIELPRWSKGRVTLIGDAAYAVSLVAGQGASLAVAGAYLLSQELCAQHSIDEALQSYERRFKPVVERLQMAGRRTATWIAPRAEWQIRLRNLGLNVAQLPGFEWLVKRMFLSGSKSLNAI